MPIFSKPFPYDWVPTVSAVAPLTFTGATVVFAKYAVDGGICYFTYAASGTIGGTLAASFISLSAPVPCFDLGAGMAYVATVVNAGLVLVARGRVLTTADSLDIIRSSDAGDIAWAAGATSIFGSGFYFIG